jgi:putative flippase GtrA
MFPRYILVGIINTIISYALFSFFLLLGLDYKIANLCSLLLSILLSFTTQGHFVFKNKSLKIFPLYFIFCLSIYFANIILIYFFIKLGFNTYISGALALPFIVPISFFSQKKLFLKN